MIDSKDQVRTLMKVAALKQSHAATTVKQTLGATKVITGKEKAQLLKLMKGKGKVQTSSDNQTVVTESSLKRLREPALNLLPPVSQTNTNNAQNSDYPQVPVQEDNVQQSINAPKLTQDTIPSGFFDDPIEELAARGISMKHQIQRQEEIERSELKEFMKELTEISEDTSYIDTEFADESEARDYEDSAVQMAYITKLVKLYKQADDVVPNRNGYRQDEVYTGPPVSTDFETALNSADIESRILLSTAVIVDEDSSSATTHNESSENALLHLVESKLAESSGSKRKMVDDETESEGEADDDYDPLLFI